MNEPILVENKDRFVLFPIKYKDIWEFYKKAEASFCDSRKKLILLLTLQIGTIS